MRKIPGHGKTLRRADPFIHCFYGAPHFACGAPFFVDFTCRLFWALSLLSARCLRYLSPLLPAVLGSFLPLLPAVSKNAYAFRSKCINFWKHSPLLQFFDTKLPLNVSIFGNRANQAVQPEIPVSYAKNFRQKPPLIIDYYLFLLYRQKTFFEGFTLVVFCRVLSVETALRPSKIRVWNI